MEGLTRFIVGKAWEAKIFPVIPVVDVMDYYLSTFRLRLVHTRLSLTTEYRIAIGDVALYGLSEMQYPLFVAPAFPSPLLSDMILSSFGIDADVMAAGMWYYVQAIAGLRICDDKEMCNALHLALLHDMEALFPSTEEWVAAIEATMTEARIYKPRQDIKHLSAKL